jgi:peptide/nickel transport system permease protein
MAAVLEAPLAVAERRGWRRIFGVLTASSGLQRATLIFGLLLITLFIVVAVFAPLIAPYGYSQNSSGGVAFVRQQAPSGAHWFGTSVRGEDVLSRVIFGARTALEVIALSLFASAIIGVVLGLVSGYIGRWIDRILVVFMDAIYAFPSLLLAIVVSIVVAGGQSSAFGGILSASIAITVVFIPQYFRVVRNETVAVKQEPYVDAAHLVPAHLRQRHPLAAGHRHAQRFRGDPDAGRARVPRVRHRADLGRRVGL